MKGFVVTVQNATRHNNIKAVRHLMGHDNLIIVTLIIDGRSIMHAAFGAFILCYDRFFIIFIGCGSAELSGFRYAIRQKYYTIQFAFIRRLNKT